MASTTPRLRMSPVQYRRSRSHASISEAGPSRLPSLSQILDLDMKDMPLSDDQFSFNTPKIINTPKITTTPTPTRSDNPAAVLRALLSRLPAHPPSPTKSSTEHERESDFDTVSESNAAPSIAQESLKHVFSNALRDPGNTPQKSRRKRDSTDSSEVEGRVEKERAKNRGGVNGLENSTDSSEVEGRFEKERAKKRGGVNGLDNSTDSSEVEGRFEKERAKKRSGVNGLDNSNGRLQRTEELSSTSPPSLRRQKSPKSPKIRVLDAFGREQDPYESHVEAEVAATPSHSTVSREDAEVAATPSHSTVSRGELLSRIRNGLDDLVVGIDDLDKDGQPLSIGHDRVQELTTISNRSRGLRERLISQADTSRSSISKASWFPANPKVYMFLIILQLSLTWLVYRISINRAQELWLNRYYDPFNPELHLYIFKSDASIHVLGSEGARTTAWSSLVGLIWDGWIYFTGNMQFHFWRAWDKGSVLRFDNTRTPT